MPSKLINDTMRNLPHIWCPGCSNGIIMRNVVQAVENLGLDHDKVVIVSGIGCSSRAPGYMDFNTLHTTHGRALAFATGVKMASPGLEVIVITGDGDATAIGGNHLIHAARRNIGLSVIVFNNCTYGMTGGQYSPTTPYRDKATTAPYGNVDRDFDIPLLAQSAGATFTARGTAYHVQQTTAIIQRAIEHKGFSLVDCVCACPTYYGRKNKKGGAVELMQWQRDNAVPVEKAGGMSAEEMAGKFIFGVLSESDYPEYTKQYDEIINKFAKEGS